MARIGKTDVRPVVVPAAKPLAKAPVELKQAPASDFKAGSGAPQETDAKQQIAAAYGLTENPLSKDELATMSLVGRQAIDLSKALQEAAANAE
jgi:hypothetical protein